jgi:hypothetical protein
MKNLAQSIPARIRQALYSIIGTAIALEAIFDLIEPGWESKILATIAVLGFGTAALNVDTPTPLPPPLPRDDRGSGPIDLLVIVVVCVFLWLLFTRVLAL